MALLALRPIDQTDGDSVGQEATERIDVPEKLVLGGNGFIH